MQPVIQHFRSHDGLRLVADRWGPDDGPDVLLLHGGGQSRYAWKDTGQRLAALGFRVTAIDSRGHGDSDWSPTGQYDMLDFSRDIVEILRELPAAPAVVGASMGGMSSLLAQRSATDQLFSSVVLVDVTPRMNLDGVARIMQFMAAHPDGFADLDEAAAAISGYNPHRAKPRSSAGLERVLRQGEDGRWVWRWDPKFVTWRQRLDSSSATGFEDRMDRMARDMYEGAEAITSPILLVRGQQSDLVSDDVAKEFRERLPNAAYVDIRGAGHMVAGDDNDAFTSAVTRFLTTVNSSTS
ncbi:MAG: alpha/beta hydrolase [Rhodococcus sp. (in: high G+C Gram-positive bacteria)]